MNKDKDTMLHLARYNAKLFSDVTRINIQIYEYYDGVDMVGCIKGCSFCRWLEDIESIKIDCRKVVSQAGLQSLKYGGKHIIFCNTGFIHFVSPITLEDRLIATVVGGPVVVGDSSEAITTDIMERFGISPIHKEETIKRIIALPNLTPDIIAKTAELLKIMVNYITHSRHLIAKYHLSDSANLYFQLENTEHDILQCFEDNDSSKALEIINHAFYSIAKFQDSNFNSTKNLCLEFSLMLSAIASEYGRKNGNIYGEKYQYLKILEKVKDLEELEKCMRILFYNFIEMSFESHLIKHNEVILRTIDYIKQNYMTKITLESAASYVFLSPSYLSKIFKEEVGNNFNHYLNTVRIENAKKLLVNDNINLVNIASLVGYEDQSYFSKVFKRITGITPKKYKESRGILKKQRGKNK